MKKVYIPMYIYENDEDMPTAKAGRTTIASGDVEIWDDNYTVWNDGGAILSIPNDKIIEDYEVTESLAQIETFDNILKRLVTSSKHRLNAIFGANTLLEVVTLNKYEEIVKKINEFDNNPKIGQIWQRPITGIKALVVKVQNDYVSIISVPNSDIDDKGNFVSELSKESFYETYENTGKTSTYYNALIGELRS